MAKCKMDSKGNMLIDVGVKTYKLAEYSNYWLMVLKITFEDGKSRYSLFRMSKK